MYSQVKSCLDDLQRMRRLAADSQSFNRYAKDRVLSMLIDKVALPQDDKVRQIRFKDGSLVTYRLNKGDVQSIREVYLDESYQLPLAGKRKTLIDLGGNIGLSTMWLATKYECESLICVEPSNENLSILKQNIANNRLPVTLIEAAVGETDGEAFFETNDASNLGHLSTTGIKVRLVSMATVMKELAQNQRIDLLKIDIEGGETALLTKGDRSWLQSVSEIVIEMHPPIVDRPHLITVLEQAGFTYFAPGPNAPNSMDYFRREPAIA